MPLCVVHHVGIEAELLVVTRQGLLQAELPDDATGLLEAELPAVTRHVCLRRSSSLNRMTEGRHRGGKDIVAVGPSPVLQCSYGLHKWPCMILVVI